MEKQRTTSPVSLVSRQIAQQKPSGAMAEAECSSVYKVRVPKNLAKKYSIMRFQNVNVDFSSISKAQMSRITETAEERESENLPTFGAGSEFGRERREEARKKRRGFVAKEKNPDATPWSLRLGGKTGKRFSGRKQAGVNENSSYYILTQCEDGAFEAVPVDSWYNFTADIKYHTLTADEAEEEFGRRERTVNYFSLMIKKRLDNKEEQEESEEKKDSNIKNASRTGDLIIHDDERGLSMSEEEDESESERGADNKADKETKKTKNKPGQKKQSKNRKGSEGDSEVSSEEDGYLDSKEVDYMSDTSSSSEEDVKAVETNKPKAEDDLNAEETSSEEEDDDLTREGLELKDMLERDEGKESWDEDDEQDPDQDEIKGTSALFLQGNKKRKGKSGSGSSTSSNSRSSTPTALVDGTASTIAAAANKLSLDRPGTPLKGKKRPASQAKKGTTSEEGSPAPKKPRVSPAPSSGGATGSSRTSTPTPSGSEEGPQGITEEAVKRYLTRKPMTTKDLLQKFKSKRTGLSNDQTVKMIATILRKLQPEQKKIKGKLYLSIKQSS